MWERGESGRVRGREETHVIVEYLESDREMETKVKKSIKKRGRRKFIKRRRVRQDMTI